MAFRKPAPRLGPDRQSGFAFPVQALCCCDHPVIRRSLVMATIEAHQCCLISVRFPKTATKIVLPGSIQDNVKHQITCRPGRTSPPLRPSLSFQYTQVCRRTGMAEAARSYKTGSIAAKDKWYRRPKSQRREWCGMKSFTLRLLISQPSNLPSIRRVHLCQMHIVDGCRDRADRVYPMHVQGLQYR